MILQEGDGYSYSNRWHKRQQLTQILRRVPSKANIADPFTVKVNYRAVGDFLGPMKFNNWRRSSRTHWEEWSEISQFQHRWVGKCSRRPQKIWYQQYTRSWATQPLHIDKALATIQPYKTFMRHCEIWKIQSETFTSPTLCVWRVVWTWHLVATTGKSRRRVDCSYPKFWHCMWLSIKGYGDTFRIEIGSLCKRHHEIDFTRQCRTKGKWELRLRYALEQSFAPYLWLNGWLFY